MSYSVGHRCSSDLGVAVAVVWASGYSSNLTPSLGISICCMCGLKSLKKRERERNGMGLIVSKQIRREKNNVSILPFMQAEVP